VVVDASIARGTPQRALVRMLREAGAREVHVRISSPPVEWPCFYGIDFATRAELIAPGLAVGEICRSLGADSLGYISLDALTEATGRPAASLCRACFDGRYPIKVPEGQAELLGDSAGCDDDQASDAQAPACRGGRGKRPGGCSSGGQSGRDHDRASRAGRSLPAGSVNLEEK